MLLRALWYPKQHIRLKNDGREREKSTGTYETAGICSVRAASSCVGATAVCLLASFDWNCQPTSSSVVCKWCFVRSHSLALFCYVNNIVHSSKEDTAISDVFPTNVLSWEILTRALLCYTPLITALSVLQALTHSEIFHNTHWCWSQLSPHKYSENRVELNRNVFLYTSKY